ncbi:hypothetical protein PVK06_011160 [Gossypium arboreum]|uniref:Uncharacterized protein n=1 Tax=Gossypium arboreum TaxID=29729 RepID=A0ABR0Q8C6_GOSAR|nr:hypothetical protein PVK06_011160 [Gossypium arboreum]
MFGWMELLFHSALIPGTTAAHKSAPKIESVFSLDVICCSLDESMSLKNFGFSHAFLATLAYQEGEKDPNQVEVKRPILQVSKDGYESLPSYMTSLASWEDLLAAVKKINSSLNNKEKTKGYNYFYQDEIEALGLGNAPHPTICL